MTEIRLRRWHIDLPGTRVDGFPWRIHVTELGGDEPGPATAIVSGITGDKPLGIIALHELSARLAGEELRGTVLVIPVANPYGFQAGTRHDPDLVELNRRFPGQPAGLLSDQLAYALFNLLRERVDAVIDLHSGTAVRTTEYAYDYGNVDLTASFAYVPVLLNRAIPGQLCTAARDAGMQASLVEFGGPDRNGTGMAIEGCLNMLRFRGHLDTTPSGPEQVTLIEKVQTMRGSRDGILCSPYGPQDVGRVIAPGEVGTIVNCVSGEILERFTAEAAGAVQPTLLLASTVPVLVRPGELVFILGWAAREISTPRR